MTPRSAAPSARDRDVGRGLYRFEEFTLDLLEDSLYKQDQKLPLNRRAFQVLRMLVENRGEIVDKTRFFETIWADTYVEDNSLTVAVAAVRKALGEDAKNPRFIENLPRKGYRFIAEVKVVRRPEAGPGSDDGSDRTVQRRYVSWKRRAAFAAFAFLLTILGLGFYIQKQDRPASAAANASRKANERPTVAVMPFENSDASAEHLSDGLAESIIEDLSRIADLDVISRNSTFKYKNSSADLSTVGRELGANLILSGRLYRDGEDLVLTVQFNDLRLGGKNWRQNYNFKYTTELAAQTEISKKVVYELHSELSAEDERLLLRHQTDDPEAARFYTKGRYYWNRRTERDFERAIEFFNKAIERDPTFARAYVGLANCYALGTMGSITMEERPPLVEASVARALELDDTLGEAYAVLGVSYTFHRWDLKKAADAYKRSTELSPNYATARHWYAELLAMTGRFEESLAEYHAALRLDPLSMAIRTDIGLTYFYSGQFERAATHFRQLRGIDPTFQRSYLYLGQALEADGKFDEAIGAFETYYTLTGEERQQRFYQRLRERFRGTVHSEYWKAKLQVTSEIGGRGPFEIAGMYAHIGDADKAFEELEKAFRARNGGLLYVMVRPEFEPLRSDPRFAVLTRRVGLE